MAQQHPSEIQVSEPCNPTDLFLQLSGNTEDSPTRNKRPHSDAPITESLEQEVSPQKKMATTQALQDDGEVASPSAPTDGTQSALEGASTFLGLLPPAPCPTPADPAEITILQLQEEVSRLSELKERIEKEKQLDIEMLQMKISLLEEELSSNAESQDPLVRVQDTQASKFSSKSGAFHVNTASKPTVLQRIVALTVQTQNSNNRLMSIVKSMPHRNATNCSFPTAPQVPPKSPTRVFK